VAERALPLASPMWQVALVRWAAMLASDRQAWEFPQAKDTPPEMPMRELLVGSVVVAIT
jgi:hypothetical protein